MSTFQERLTILFNESGMTTEEFSRKIGITRQTFNKYHNNGGVPPLDKVISIAEACDVSIDWLSGRDGDYARSSKQSYTDIMRITGLEEDSIALLEEMNQNKGTPLYDSMIRGLKFMFNQTIDLKEANYNHSLFNLLGCYIQYVSDGSDSYKINGNECDKKVEIETQKYIYEVSLRDVLERTMFERITEALEIGFMAYNKHFYQALGKSVNISSLFESMVSDNIADILRRDNHGKY